jgi:aryl carrier-like protein
MDFEARLAAIRADVAEVMAMQLSRREDDINLFDMGADSLTAVEIAARLRDVHGLEVTTRTLFETPTIKGLALLAIAADRGRP